MSDRTLVYTDRDGDALFATSRNVDGDGTWEPIISIVRSSNGNSQSVVFMEENVPDIILNMLVGLNLSVPILYNTIGKIQGIIDQKENSER